MSCCETHAIIDKAAKRLSVENFETPRLDAEVLLAYVLRCDRAGLYSVSKTPTKKGKERFDKFIKRRLKKEPVAYITGVREFWSLPIKVTPAVLIPRPETEGLIEEALKLFDKNSAISILDICTGSGCVAAALAQEFPKACLTASDISKKALKIARENLNFAGERVTLTAGNLFEAVPDTVRYDLITANPPYVSSGDKEACATGLEYEPRPALFADKNGTAVAEKIIQNALAYLKTGGCLIMEINEKHGQLLTRQAEKTGYSDIRIVKDLAGWDRVLVGRKL